VRFTEAVHGDLQILKHFVDFASLLGCAMRDLAVLFLHLLATVARLAGPGGARSVVAESLLVKQQLLILNRSRKRSTNLGLADRIVAYLRTGGDTSGLSVLDGGAGAWRVSGQLPNGPGASGA
jgi:hypothetical protein